MPRVGQGPSQVAAGAQLVPVFTFRGAKTALPSDRIRNYAVGQSAAISTSELHRFKAHNEAVVRGVGA